MARLIATEPRWPLRKERGQSSEVEGRVGLPQEIRSDVMFSIYLQYVVQSTELLYLWIKVFFVGWNSDFSGFVDLTWTSQDWCNCWCNKAILKDFKKSIDIQPSEPFQCKVFVVCSQLIPFLEKKVTMQETLCVYVEDFHLYFMPSSGMHVGSHKGGARSSLDVLVFCFKLIWQFSSWHIFAQF